MTAFYLKSSKKLPDFDPQMNPVISQVVGLRIERPFRKDAKFTERTLSSNQRKKLVHIEKPHESPQQMVWPHPQQMFGSLLTQHYMNTQLMVSNAVAMNNHILNMKKKGSPKLEEAGILIARGFNPSRQGPRVQKNIIIQNHRVLQPKRVPSSIPITQIRQTSQHVEEDVPTSPDIKKSVNQHYQDSLKDDSSYTYFVGAGNNGELVKKIMGTRPYWRQTTAINSIFNFRWTQSSANIKFDRLTGQSGVVQIVNHFPNHKDISDKSNLIQNLKLHCESKKIHIFEITPLTFVVDLASEDAELQLYRFTMFFLKNMPKHKRPDQYKKIANEYRKKFKPLLLNQCQDTFQRGQNPYTKPRMHPSFENGEYYLWLLKPSDFNRGRGIQLFDSIETFEKLLLEMKEGVSEYTIQPDDQNKCKIKSHEFVLQKYIQKPLLIHGRKFDIRVWVLITCRLDCYFFKEGYLRTSCEPFQMDNIDNAFIHLTNNAVQKQSSSYGQFEQGNQLSFDDFDQFLKQNGKGEAFYESMLPQMKSHICQTLLAVKKNFNAFQYKYCFEIFGYDFIVDESLNMWLIEVNTNPCIEESSPLLEMLIPRMLNDAFKLTIDKILRPKKSTKGEEYPDQSQNFQVDKYGRENMWEFLLTLQIPASPAKKSKL